ncbi:MAG: CAP domain-containing protein [Gammaproteobacteria bacterium]
MLHRALFPLLAATLSLSTVPLAVAGSSGDYQALSALRDAAGMPGFSWNGHLEKAASDHVRYLLGNPEASHDQSPGSPGFTGSGPSERALHVGYPSTLVSENIASGQTTMEDALDGLMAAIYHRIGFLDFEVNEAGIASEEIRGDALRNGRPLAPGARVFAFEMGNRTLSRLCADPPALNEGRFYRGACANPKIKLGASRYEQALAEPAMQAPEVVVWPPDGATDITPAFFDESPDPLPDREVSGYPISIHVNPYKVVQTRLLDFELHVTRGGHPVDAVRLLDAGSDPNGRMDTHTFALFPLDRLDWGREYEARARLNLDGRTKLLRWRFHTRPLPQPGAVLRHNGEAFAVQGGERFTLHVPPRVDAPRLGSLTMLFPQGTRVESGFFDPNTLQLTLHGDHGTRVRFESDNGHRFELHLRCGGTPSC